MKLTNARKLLLVCYLFVFGFFVEATMTGCKNPNRSAYVVEGVTINSVDTATKVFLDLVVAGKVTTAQEVAYREKYNKYFAAQKVVADLVTSVKPGEKLDETTLQTANRAVFLSSQDVIAFVGSFGKK